MTANCLKHPFLTTKASLAIGLAACIVSVARADILLVEGTEVRRYSDSGTFLGTFAQGAGFPARHYRGRWICVYRPARQRRNSQV